MTASWYSHLLEFKRPGGTSRGVLHHKETFILEISDEGKKAIGECALFRGLSCDDVPDYPEKLDWLCQNINLPENEIHQKLKNFPSVIIGYEQALLNLKNGTDLYFPSRFTAGEDSIKINGLVWMGDAEFMQEQISEKLAAGFSCIKLKIGVNWPSEREIIKNLREKFASSELEIRVDANGAFSYSEAENVLNELSKLEIHSIEQPIKAGTPDLIAKLCRNSPTPIALDEELIGIIKLEEKIALLETVKPQYIILKPSLCGGFSGTDEWISEAEKLGIDWWITSALESNIGLNAIAQYTYTKQNPMPQGLGTGALFVNNFESKLYLEGDRLFHQ